MLKYKTSLRGNRDGSATYGAAFVLSDNGITWLLIGHTKNYRTYPQLVRARSAAEHMCRVHQRKHFPLSTLTLIKE
jgi:hypothetical protein